MKDVLFFIPARKNSKGLPFKNRKLLKYTLDSIPVEYRNQTLISTDDEIIIKEAKKYNVKVHIRPSQLAADTTSIRDVLLNISLTQQLQLKTIIVLYLTYPERTWNDIINAYNFYIANKATTLLCKKETKVSPYLMLEERGIYGTQVINHNLYRRQDYPKVFELSHYIAICSGHVIRRLNNNLYNQQTVFFPITHKVDVDTQDDYEELINKEIVEKEIVIEDTSDKGNVNNSFLPKIVNTLSQLIDKPKKENIQHKKIAVILHLYWLDLWKEFKNTLSNITEDYDLYISIMEYTNTNIKKEILDFKPDACIIDVANKGMDIGGTFMIMKEILKRNKSYDYYLKLHSKKSLDTIGLLHRNGGSIWRYDLIQPICGTVENFSNCINLFKIQNIGMIGSRKWLMNVQTNKTVLEKNSAIIEEYINKFKLYNVTLNDTEFIGGTMFWVRGTIWESFFNSINIDDEYEKFNDGKLNDMLHPSYAHSMERIFGLIIKNANYKIHGI